MAVNLSPVGGVAAQFFTNSGYVLTGGKLYTYSAGTTTPATTYTNSQGNTSWTNPIVLDAAGRVPGSGEVWLADGANYKFVLKDSNDVLIATYDNISGINSNYIAYTSEQEIQTATAGQTVFTLTTMNYLPGTNSLSVFVDGVNQYGPGAQYSYVETDSSTVTFNAGLHVGAEVKFTTTQQQGAGAVDASQVSYDPPFIGSVATNVEAKLAQTVSVKDFGADPTGTVDSSQSIQDAVDSGANAIYFPAGFYLIKNSIILSTAQKLYGDGIQKSILLLESSGATPALNAFSVQSNNVEFEDLTFDINVNGQTVCRAITFEASVEHIYCDRCEFKSTDYTVNNVSMWISGFDVKNLYVSNCRFDTVQFGIGKDNSDTSTQQYTNWTNCSFYNCSDGLTINSPLGAWTDICVSNCNFESMHNFPISFAGTACGRASITGCNFYDSDIEAIHAEANSTAIAIEGCTFSFCCKTISVVGNISLITGANNVSITGCHFQLDVGGTPIGISVQQGGGSTAYNTTIIGNTFRCTSITTNAILVSTTYGIVISDNVFINTNIGAKCSAFINAANSHITGSNNSFNNPAVLINVDDNSYGSLSLTSIYGNLSGFAFLNGNTNGSTSICFQGFDITQDFTCNSTSSVNNPLFPAGTIFDGTVGARFVSNGTNDAFVITSKLKFNNSALTSSDLFQYSGVSGSQFVAFNKTSTNICGTGYRASSLTGSIHVNFNGVYFP